MKVRQDTYLSWAWTAKHVADVAQAERQSQSVIILPDQPRPDDAEPALCHFSTLRGGEQYSWIWLFDNATDAVTLKLLPSFLTPDDPAGTLIAATLPDEMQHGKTNYLQQVPMSWLKDLDLAVFGIHEVWFGFNYKQFIQDRSLRAAAAEVLGVDEFQKICR